MILPFSALQAAYINPGDVCVIATTPDREIETWRKCKCDKAWHPDGPHSVKVTQHFLGETLFMCAQHPGAFYVSGLDRNDDPSKRNFYLAELPTDARPRTVDQALEALKPEGLPETGWLRQGEWFLVPSDVKPKKEDVIRESRANRYGADRTKPGVPIVTADSDRMREQLASEWPWELITRARRHRATRM